MDALRSINLNNILSTTSSSCSGIQLEPIDNVKVNSMVESFKNLNKSEQILFLTRIGGGPPTRLELEDTRNWLRANFIEDELVALPKEEVYAMYRDHTTEKGIKPVSTADFGKVVRQVFHKVKARRLGQRGQSRYCYANIRRKIKPDEPLLPLITPVEIQDELSTDSFISTVGKLFGIEFKSLEEVALLMVQQNQCHQNGLQEKVITNGSKIRCIQKRLESPSSIIEKGILKREDSCDEMAMYFRTDSPSTPSTTPSTTTSSPPQWPHLRQLLTSNSKFQPLKRHRHYSSVNTDQMTNISPSSMSVLRSQSVPLYYIQDVELDSGLSSMTNTPNSIGRNPMLSSVNDEIIRLNDAALTSVLGEGIEDGSSELNEFDLGFGDGFVGDFEEGL